MWNLLRIFPVMGGEKLKNDAKFLHFIELSEIFRLLYSDAFDHELIELIRNKIAIYLRGFEFNYPGKRITPKQHFLIHYPSAIKNFGPPKLYSVMRFEGKHSYFNRVHSANHNHRNLLKSLANRHQNLQVYHLTSPDYFVDIELGSTCDLSKNTIDFISILLNTTNFDPYKWVIKRGIKYHIDSMIVTSIKYEKPVYSKIKTIIYLKNKKEFFWNSGKEMTSPINPIKNYFNTKFYLKKNKAFFI